MVLSCAPLHILIIAATRLELNAARERDMESVLGVPIKLTWLTAVGDYVGAVPTAVAAMRAGGCQHFDFAINVGFCGTHRRESPIGTNVIVTHDTFLDYGFQREDGFLPLHATRFPMPHCDTDGWLTTTTPSLLPYAPSSIPRRRGYTVSHPTQGGQYTAEGIPIPQEAIETMEGAAFAYAMAELRTPSLAIRTISNYCAPMASAQWDIHTAQNGVQKAITQSLQIIASYHNEQKGQQ